MCRMGSADADSWDQLVGLNSLKLTASNDGNMKMPSIPVEVRNDEKRLNTMKFGGCCWVRKGESERERKVGNGRWAGARFEKRK